jgi:GH15 family glucan-1,4-alpha-glucosidase
MQATAGAARIEDHGLIGDLQTAALVDINGSIDWLCLPRFDSGAAFTALLGDEEHGHWTIQPAVEPLEVSRRYRPGTLVLETTFRCEEGTVRLTDLMPIREELPSVIRIVEGLEGSVQMQMRLVPRFEYGFTKPWLIPIPGGVAAYSGPNALYLYTPGEVDMDLERLMVTSEFLVTEREKVPFVMTYQNSFEEPPYPIDAQITAAETESWWQGWSGQCTYTGEWRDQVLTSLLALKALTYKPTGAVIAAPTTSLPEEIGGERNWDYRYCWIRDGVLVLHALNLGGYREEQDQFVEWFLRAVAGPPEQGSIMYGIGGDRWLPERTLEWLPGYEGSAPVRIGNAAADQFQLDIFGEGMDAVHYRWSIDGGIEQPEFFIAIVLPVLDYLEKIWQDPDEGIWEVRGSRRHFTYSRVMAWVAFDRAVDAAERLGGEGGEVDHWRTMRQEIHDQVCREGYDPERRTFTQYYGSRELDASALLIPAVGFLPASDERVIGTVEAIERELTRDGFVYRYSTEEGAVDGLAGREGVFLPCSFWLVDALAMIGRLDDARQLFERLLTLANDLGLYSEEYDPVEKRQLGNFPQAFTHLALVNSASMLSGTVEVSPARHMHGHRRKAA